MALGIAEMAWCCSLYFTVFIKFGSLATCLVHEVGVKLKGGLPEKWAGMSILIAELLTRRSAPSVGGSAQAGVSGLGVRVCGLWAFARDQPAVLFSSILSMSFPFNSSSPRLSPLCTCCRLPGPSGPKPKESLPD